MFALHNTPIRRKLMMVILLTSGAMLLLTGATLFIYEFITFRQSTVRQLSTLGQVIADNSTAALAFDNPDDAREILAALKAERHIVAAGLYRRDGTLFAHYPATRLGQDFPAVPGLDGYRFEGAYLVAFEPVVQGQNQRLGTLHLQFDMAVMRARLALYGSVVLLVIASSFLLAYFISGRLQRQITHPILALAETARAISERRDYSVRAIKLGRDEVGALTDAFNQMLVEIQDQNAALRESEERTRLIIDTALDAVITMDAAGNITGWNRQAEQILGWSRAEVLGRPMHEVIIPVEYREAHWRGLQHFLSTGHGPVLNKRIEITALRRGGESFPIELSITPLQRAGTWHFSAFMRDITERKRAEEALANERSLLRTLVDLLPDLIYVKDRESRFVTANVACARSMGKDSTQDLIGKTDADVFSRTEADLFRSDELRALAGTPVIDKEEAILLPTGGRRTLLTTKVPLRNGVGEIIGVVGAGRDITDRKRAEDEIRALNVDLERRVRERTRELELANKELESFSYSVSHDLRAPLRHIHGYVEMLHRSVKGQLSEKSQRYLTTIRAASIEMAQLIDDLLDFSRMGRKDLLLTQVDLNPILQDTLSTCEGATKGRHIEWKVATLPAVVGDSSMLKQVLANLVGNAVKYSRQRDPAVIEIGPGGEEDGREIIFVRDNGAGFDMQFAHKLFGVFQRLHRADEFEGTGIGLATVNRIVQRHGGRVWAESAVNQGATFFFTLKRAG